MNEEDLSGKTIEGYHVLRPIGQGKFATVYKAETPDNKIVALKKIKIFEMNDPKLRDKCLKEVRLMQQLEHPNIIKYLDSFISNNELIIITEWAEKGDLKKLLKNAIQSDSPIEENKIWDFMFQIGSALKHMHDKRIMHRDLKPANIFLSSDDTLKVGDFGLGRVFSEETVEAYSKVGTPLYMSPELLIGQGYDMRSDVWSLGCIIYEMCENKSPFRNENDKMSLMDLFNNITKGEYKPVGMKFSEELRKIIQDMIVVDPQKRCDISQVIDACNFWKEKQKATLKIDCLIVMEDISEKLNLLDYRTNFCLPKKRECISKVFFATSENSNKKVDKFSYFIDLAFWLIDLLKSQSKSKQKGAKEETKAEENNPKAQAKKLLDEVKKFGITFDPPITPEQLLTGYGDAACFILNELLNRQLITINFKFHTPTYNKFDNVEVDKGESDIKELDEDKLFREDPNVFDSDDDEKEDKARLISNTTYYSSSTSATSTITDHMYKNNKKGTIENGLKDIDENQLMELDSIEWGKEIDRVALVLDDFNEKIQKSQFDNVMIATHEETTQLEKIKLHSKKTKELLPLFRTSDMHKKLQEWDSAVIQLQKGEKRINDACAHLTDNLRDIVLNKKQVYDKLTFRTEKMKEKIAYFDEINKKYNKINQVLAEKDQEMLGDTKKVDIKKAIERMKIDIKELDTKAEVIKTFLLNRKAHSKEVQNKTSFQDDLVQ